MRKVALMQCVLSPSSVHSHPIANCIDINNKREISNKKTVTNYSPWRRVATKLGVK